VEEKEVNWAEYYARIKQVCPWSYKAYMTDKILVWKSPYNSIKTLSGIFDSTSYEAFVYVYRDHTPEQLDKLVIEMNKYRHKSEFLWSHPEADSGDGNSTDIPVIIQQNKKVLNNIRDKINGEQNEY
jgi:hypothetical protein